MNPIKRTFNPMIALGAVAILAGLLVVVLPLLGVWQRAQADDSALGTWEHGGSQKLAQPFKGSVTPGAACGSTDPSLYALVTFLAPAQYHYAGVATDGNWDSLSSFSMVHYHGTPAPGQQGNSIFAFHREPDFEHIDQLKVGDRVQIQDRSCAVWTYQVTSVWTGAPDKVSQLVPTGGHELTMITCTPWWQDYNRIVWRAELVGPGVSS